MTNISITASADVKASVKMQKGTLAEAMNNGKR
jgi:hypothetical protein